MQPSRELARGNALTQKSEKKTDNFVKNSRTVETPFTP